MYRCTRRSDGKEAFTLFWAMHPRRPPRRPPRLRPGSLSESPLGLLPLLPRFGAEDLFKGSEEEAARQQQRAMMEEDIDAILERAEVVEAREGGEG